MAAGNKVEFKTAQAIGDVIAGLNLSNFNVYQIHETEELTYPAAIVHCEGGKEYLPQTGLFEVKATVAVYSQGDNGETNHHSRVESIRDSLMNTGIAATLSAAESDFTAIDCSVDEIDNGVDKNRSLVSTITLKLIACGSDV